MSRGATLVLADGSMMMVKRATGTGARMLREAGERLRAASHPGVVTVLDSRGDDQGWELHLAYGGRPVNLLHPLSPEQVARIVETAATILADLHERGIVHGRLATRHVLVGRSGQIQLCGFGPTGPGAAAADDVAALGQLIVELLGAREVLEPIPDQRWRRRRPWAGVARRALLMIADQATVERASRRPTAQRLATTIAEAVPSTSGRARRPPPRARPSRRSAEPAATTTPPQTARADDDPRSMAAWAPLIAALAGVVLVVSGASRLREAPPNGGGSTTAAPAQDQEADPCIVFDETAPSACAAPVSVRGNSVAVADRRFVVGQPGDELAVGDWDCDGAATVGLVRPSTGEVFVFPGWALAGDLVIRPLARVPGAVSLEVPRGGVAGQCDPVVLHRTDGTRTSLVLPPGDAS